MSKIFKSLITKTRVFRSFPKQKPTITFYFWRIRKLEKHHLIDLMKSFPMVPISSSHTSYWESPETILIFAPVSKIFDTGFRVNFAKHKPLLSTLCDLNFCFAIHLKTRIAFQASSTRHACLRCRFWKWYQDPKMII